MSINLILAEFGSVRRNCGGGDFTGFSRLEPTISTFLKYFPKAKVTVYSDVKINANTKNSELKIVPPLAKGHKRSSWRSSSYYKHKGLLDSDCEISIAMDSDFYVYSPNVKYIIPLTKKFGCCTPLNPRYTVRKDTLKGADSDKKLDESGGFGLSVNTGIVSFHRDNKKARKFLEAYCERRKVEGRGTISFWRTIWEFGDKYTPYILPPQWNVCREHCGIGEEIVLHIGHKQVRKYYKL